MTEQVTLKCLCNLERSFSRAMAIHFCVSSVGESSSTCSSESLIQFYLFDLNILDSRQFTARAHLCKTNYPTDQHVARDFIPFSVSHPFMHLYSCVPHPLRFVSTVICNLLALTMAATRRLQKVKVSWRVVLQRSLVNSVIMMDFTCRSSKTSERPASNLFARSWWTSRTSSSGRASSSPTPLPSAKGHSK